MLKVPRTRVQEAVQRLGALGTIVGENVSIQDLQAGIDTTGRTIARLQAQLATLRATQPQTDETSSSRSRRSRPASSGSSAPRAATIRAARYFATVELHLDDAARRRRAGEKEDGPLHGLGVAFRWIGIGAVYALALGTPRRRCSSRSAGSSPAACAAGARKLLAQPGLRLDLGEDAERRRRRPAARRTRG